MEYENLIVEKIEENIALVTLNRPKNLNALNQPLMRDIERVTEEFHDDLETRVVIFTGSGRLFSAGADLRATLPPSTLLGRQRFFDIGPRMIRKLYEMEQITFAAINGGAFGGGACIASALDFRIGDENCSAGFPENRIGMNLSWRALPLAVHLIGPTYAKEMVILGKNVDAQTLLKWGFLSEVVPKERLIPRTLELAREYAAMPPIPAQMIKKSINHISSALDEAIMHQDRDQFILTLGTDDLKVAIANFFGKRQRKYKGD